MKQTIKQQRIKMLSYFWIILISYYKYKYKGMDRLKREK